MPPLLIARPPGRWRTPLAVLALVAYLALGLVVIVLRTVRVVVNLATAAAMDAEQQLAARTGRTALSHSGIRALAAAFAHEFLTAYRAPAR
jgi:hypothetical protein